MAHRGIAKHKNVFEQVDAIKANDEEVLRCLYQNNYDKVQTFVLNNNGSAEQAKDIFQEAFIALWRNVQLGRFHPANETALDGYLYQIARNKWMDHLRSSHHNRIVSMNGKMPEPDTHSISEDEIERLQAVKKHYGTLGENCKKVLTKFYYDNASLKEIASSMGWTEATARNNKYRCIQQLRELLNKQAVL